MEEEGCGYNKGGSSVGIEEKLTGFPAWKPGEYISYWEVVGSGGKAGLCVCH